VTSARHLVIDVYAFNHFYANAGILCKIWANAKEYVCRREKTKEACLLLLLKAKALLLLVNIT